MILPSSNDLEKQKQKHSKGPGRPPKAKGRPSEGRHPPERP